MTCALAPNASQAAKICLESDGQQVGQLLTITGLNSTATYLTVGINTIPVTVYDNGTHGDAQRDDGTYSAFVDFNVDSKEQSYVNCQHIYIRKTISREDGSTRVAPRGPTWEPAYPRDFERPPRDPPKPHHGGIAGVFSMSLSVTEMDCPPTCVSLFGGTCFLCFDVEFEIHINI